MGFPGIIYGKLGDQYRAQSTAIGGLPLGALMVINGASGTKWFRHARAQTSAALSAGQLCVAGSTIPDHGCGTADQMVANSAAIGATTIVITAGGTTAIATDYYAGGEMFVRDDTGEGYVYSVSANNSTATGSTCTVTLEPTDSLRVALGASATVGLRRNPYREVITRATGSAMVGPIVGVPVAAVSSGYYCWLQTRGTGPALVAATVVVIGQPVYASSATAGAVAGFNVASTGGPVYNEVDSLGRCHAISGSTEYALVDWRIE